MKLGEVRIQRNGAQQGGDQAGDDDLDGGGLAGHEGSSKAEQS